MNRSSGRKLGKRTTNVERAAELAAEREKAEKRERLEKFDAEAHEWEKTSMNFSSFNIDFLEKLRLDRNILEKLIYKPNFEKTLIGCVVRVNLGNKYQVCTILEVKKTGKLYVLGKTQTNSRLLVKTPLGQEILLPMANVSNQKFTLIEFRDWKQPLADKDLPCLAFIKHKLIAIHKLSLYEFSKEQMKQIEEEKRILRLPMKSLVMKKIDLLADRREALGYLDYTLAAQLTAQIEEIDRETQLMQLPPHKFPNPFRTLKKRSVQNVEKATQEEPETEPATKQQKTDSLTDFDGDMDIRTDAGTENSE